MADIAANRMSGGPHVYVGAYGQALPTLTGSSLTWSNNEVQTITPASTWTSGDYTLEVTYPDGTSETTAAIALDADAAAIKAALAALTNLDAADLTVTGGPLNATGPVVPVVVTFGGTYANTDMPMIAIDVTGIVGGGTATVAETTKGRLWTETPDVVKSFDIKPVHKTEEHRPAYSEHPTGSVSVDVGVAEIAFEIAETDLDAFNLALPAALKSTTAAAAGTVGYETLEQADAADIDGNYVTICTTKRGPVAGGWGILEHFYRCKRKMDQAVKEDTGSRMIKVVFEVFADTSNSNHCSKKYQYIAPATS